MQEAAEQNRALASTVILIVSRPCEGICVPYKALMYTSCSFVSAQQMYIQGLPASGVFPCTFEITDSQVGAASWSVLTVFLLLLLSGGQCPCLSMFDLS